MNYSRGEMLKLAAAGTFAAALPMFLIEEAYAEGPEPPTSGSSQGPGKDVEVLDLGKEYGQEKADDIHNRVVEREIEKAGEKPEEVKKHVENRLQDLKEKLPPQADTGGLSRALEALKNRW